MNPINPKKLLLSKWTAVNPHNREKHFMVTKLAEDENANIIGCTLEALLTKREIQLDWRQLQNPQDWLQGWK